MEKNNLFQRFRYWLDKRMAKGTGSMIRALLFATIFMVLFLAFYLIIFGEMVMSVRHFMRYGIVLQRQSMQKFHHLQMDHYFSLLLMRLPQSLVYSLLAS